MTNDALERARERIIVALDVPDADEAARAVQELAGHVGGFKVGLELLTGAGPPSLSRSTSPAPAILRPWRVRGIIRAVNRTRPAVERLKEVAG